MIDTEPIEPFKLNFTEHQTTILNNDFEAINKIMRILIVEDEKGISNFLKDGLSSVPKKCRNGPWLV